MIETLLLVGLLLLGFVLVQGVQTFGIGVGSGDNPSQNATLAALGTNQGTAALLAADVTVVTGADGTKGVILPLPTTANQILTVINTGTSNLPIYPNTGAAIDAGSANAQYNLPAATAVRFIATSTTQWYEIKADPLFGLLPTATVASAGSSQGTAAALTAIVNNITGADGTKAAVLPTAQPGMKLFIQNQGTFNLPVYPATGAAIDGIAANSAVNLPAGCNMVIEATSTTQWYAVIAQPHYGLLPTATVAATGSVIGDAAALTAINNLVTGADGTKGVQLPVGIPGMRIFVQNNVASILKVWPGTGGAISGGSANAAFSQSASKNAFYVCTAALTWQAVLSA